MVEKLTPHSFDDVTVLLLGAEPEGMLDRNARRVCEEMVKAGLKTYRLDFSEIGRLAELEVGETVVVWPFFPHSFWDAHCETPSDGSFYGASEEGFESFRAFCGQSAIRLESVLAGKRVIPFVDLKSAFVDRDKLVTSRLLVEAGVPAPHELKSRKVDDILREVMPRQGIFVKCRYGAEGKGITYLSADGWWTNYLVGENGLGNYGVRDRWEFTNISGRYDLLEQLLGQEVIIEREIVTPEVEDGTKFDIRAYVIRGEVPHMFLRINQRDAFITNFSQGARVEHRYAEVLPRDLVQRLRDIANRAANALQTPFVGIDLMVDHNLEIYVVEAQVFTDFPDPNFFNLPLYMANLVRTRFWEA